MIFTILLAKLKSTCTHESLSQNVTRVSSLPRETYVAPRGQTARQQYAEKRESKRNGFGREHIGTWEHSTAGTTRQTFPCHAHWKYAANPCCRTFRNTCVRCTRSEPSRHKIVYRSYRSAMASIWRDQSG